MKKISTARRIELLIYPAIACMMDGTLTVAGQPDSYFKGDYATAEEMNPIGYLALSTSPSVFVIGLALWIITFCTLIFSFRELTSHRISFGIAALHVFGAGTWLMGWNLGILWVFVLFSAFRFLAYPRFVLNDDQKTL